MTEPSIPSEERPQSTTNAMAAGTARNVQARCYS